jgi:hypothetical protein
MARPPKRRRRPRAGFNTRRRRRRNLRRPVHRPSADETRSAMATGRRRCSYNSTQSVAHRGSGQLARHRRVEHRPRRRILRRRVGRGAGAVDGDSGCRKGRRAGMVRQPGGEHLSGCEPHGGARAGFGEDAASPRSIFRSRTTARGPMGDHRSAGGGVAHLAAAGDALARPRHDHEYAAAHPAAIARADAGQRSWSQWSPRRPGSSARSTHLRRINSPEGKAHYGAPRLASSGRTLPPPS